MEEIFKDTPIGGENHKQFANRTSEEEADLPSIDLNSDELKANFPRLADAIAQAPAEKDIAPMTTNEEAGAMHDQIIEAIKTVYDPEIPVNIYELGLIYEVKIGEDRNIDVLMTLTSPGCPAAGMLPGDVEEKVRSVEGVGDVKVEVTFDPPWDQSMMTDEARLELGFM